MTILIVHNSLHFSIPVLSRFPPFEIFGSKYWLEKIEELESCFMFYLLVIYDSLAITKSYSVCVNYSNNSFITYTAINRIEIGK